MNKKGLAIGRILQAARSRFSQDGYEATSIESLLQDLGISRGALYHHFKSKEDLFSAVLDAVESDVASATLQAAQEEQDPARALMAGFEAFLQLASQPEVRQIVLIDAPSVVGWKKWREIEEQYALGSLKRALSAMASQGQVDPAMCDVFAHLLLSTQIELALLVAHAENRTNMVQISRNAMQRVLAGLFQAKSPQQ